MQLRPARLVGIREFLRLFVSISTSYVRWRLAFSLSVAVALSLFASTGPLLLKWIVDALSKVPERGTGLLLSFAGAYVFVQWSGRALAAAQGYIQAQADRRLYRALSDQLFDHVIRLPLRYHLGRRTGAVSEILSNGLLGFQMVQQTLLMSIVPILIQLAMVSIVLITLHQEQILLLFLLAVVAYGAVFSQSASRTRKSARDVAAAQIDARALMTDSILNYETVKYFAAESIIRERLDKALMQSERDWLKFHFSRSWSSVLVATVFAGFLGATMFVAVREVVGGRMTVGTFVLVNAYLLQLVAPIEMIGAATQTLSQGFAFLEKLVELFGERAESPSSAVVPCLRGPGKLTFVNVSGGYAATEPTLKHISFVLPAGRTLGIVGASGAGKSTLVRLLTRLLEPDEGHILIDDVSIHESELASVRGAIAVVPQDTVLFNETIAYNIAFGRPGATRAEIEDAARLAELHDFIVKLPLGYETLVGERGVRLSGGEKQRVSIARAALKNPCIYVFDEATSSLDSRTEKEILRNLTRLAAKTTTVIIAHRLSTVIHADMILVLDQGVIVEAGLHESLVEKNGHYASLWLAQQADAEPRTAA